MRFCWLIAASAIVLGLSAPARSADLTARPYVKAPAPMASTIYDWSGLYLGINAGGGSARECWNLVTDQDGAAVNAPNHQGCHDATGATVGGQLGYRWQASSWVFGVEGQGNWADFSGSNRSANVVAPFNTDTNRSRIDSFGLITGHVGYAWSNVLTYVKGGAAVVGSNFDRLAPNGAVNASASETRWGGTVGAGLEIGFAPNWSVGVEYNHVFLSDRNSSFTTPAGNFDGTDRVHQNVDMGMVRVNYRWGGPAVAKY
ncbi:MAG: outer membrane beta-barrel protein [Alphaproteobacteria bacterium]|nr:outer membrane beta-barrel protein [Alphaproteobacteria bacterium]